MKKLVENPAQTEKIIKEYYCVPDYVMMENAGKSLFEYLQDKDIFSDSNKKILIICGKGNNGGDGLVLARMLYCFDCAAKIIILCENVPVQKEALSQYNMLKKMNVEFSLRQDFLNELQKSTKDDIIFDCLYGIGFHGEWRTSDAELIIAMNNSIAQKVACDISSGLSADGKAGSFNGNKLVFKADSTVCMGTLKLAYFSDDGKRFSGKLIQGNLGIPINSQIINTDIFLLEQTDFKLPYRFDPASHKGTYGHTAVFAGEKSGAAILSATAALYAGTGLSTIVKTENSNLEQFKINPQLMVSQNLPEKTRAVVLGNGLGKIEKNTIDTFLNWFNGTEYPACVLDADIFYYSKLKQLLEELLQTKESRVILTPHPKELASLAKLCSLGDYSIEQASVLRKEIGLAFSKKFPKMALLMKGADTYIALNNCIYIFAMGDAALAKAGSGDILAGIIVGLLAQGYSTEDACFTGCNLHAECAKTRDYKRIKTIGASDFRLLSDDMLSALNKKTF